MYSDTTWKKTAELYSVDVGNIIKDSYWRVYPWDKRVKDRTESNLTYVLTSDVLQGESMLALVITDRNVPASPVRELDSSLAISLNLIDQSDFSPIVEFLNTTRVARSNSIEHLSSTLIPTWAQISNTDATDEYLTYILRELSLIDDDVESNSIQHLSSTLTPIWAQISNTDAADEYLTYILRELSLIDDDAEELQFPRPTQDIKSNAERILHDLYLKNSIKLQGDVCLMRDGSICIYFHGPCDSIVSIYCNEDKSYCYSNIREHPKRSQFVAMQHLPDEFVLRELSKLDDLHYD
ncbi:MAG: hypothetical protein F4Z14_05215 [Gammaproteobacteria bacterium]|nr:hypothetical protein [Gammaproteobacteria bacterium]